MGKIKRYRNIVERFLSGESGQRFFNIAYSIGAAIVIWGALFKLLHLPGGDLLLCIGMGTEVLMFILTAFDRPPREPDWNEIIPLLGASGASGVSGRTAPAATSVAAANDTASLTGNIASLDENARKLNQAMESLVSSLTVADGAGAVNTSLSTYAEQLQTLNRNLAGLNAIYEIQLRNVSSQLDSSGAYGEEARRLTENLRRLNSVYEQVLAAMSPRPVRDEQR